MPAPPTSRRPYLLRAMHEWMTDNGQTAHVLVNAAVPGVQVPPAAVRDGRITLNISWQATDGLRLGNDWVEFTARFNGVVHPVRLPLPAVLGIYARETGQGMLFEEEGTPPPPAPGPDDTGSRPKLRVVK